MGWLSSVVDGVKAIGTGLNNGAKWLWNNVSLSKLTFGAVSYTANTTVQVLEQGIALRDAVPTLINNPQAKKIVNGAGYVLVNDVLPMVAVNFANNAVQNYFSDDYSGESAWFMPYVLGLSTLTVVGCHYLSSYLWRKDPKPQGVVDTFISSDFLPAVAVDFTNNVVQSYFRYGYNKDIAWYAPYALFLSGLTLVDYLVTGYGWRQGAQTLAHAAVLDSLGPSAFNSNKKTLPPSICDKLDCNYKRKIKGWGREPLILMGNDALTYGVSLIPYVGKPLSTVLRVYFNGRYIIRLTTPELCERHKYLAMKPESVLGFGLTSEATNLLMDKILESTVGIPPYLYYRALRHLLMLSHVNVAAHMTLPQMDPKTSSPYSDPFNVYERVNRLLVDIVFDGAMKRIPIDFKPDKDAEPLIPLSPALQFGTMVLNMDLEQEKKAKPSFFKKAVDKAFVFVVPSIFRGPDGLINDPIVFMYWPTIRSGAISAAELVEGVGKTKTMATLAWAPKTVAAAVNLKFGIPKKVTRFVLMLSKEEDFWNLVTAFKLWFERHNIKGEAKVITGSNLALNGITLLEPTPPPSDKVAIVSQQQLVTEKEDAKSVVPANSLVPDKPQTQIVLTVISPDNLFVTRKRRGHKEQESTSISELILTK